MNFNSILLILTSDMALADQLNKWLSPFGWRCTWVTRTPLDGISTASPAVIVLDGRLGHAALRPVIRWTRDLAGPESGVPILLCGSANDPAMAGANDRIAFPLDQADCLDTLQLWAGPLADHGFRDMASPRYRLTRLAGSVRADKLLDGFTTALTDALTQIREGGDLKRHAHQIAGMAGTIGFADLGRAWSAVDRGAPEALDAARHMAEEVLRTLQAEAQNPPCRVLEPR
ncbi:hypothetical protein BH10PSE12_BH10PSE12_16700 [soil metagenome]